MTGVILAGGRSRRFGSNKALSAFRGERLIERLVRAMREVVDDLLLVTNTPDEYAFLGLRMVGDVRPDCGALGGLYTGILSMTSDRGVFVACDMPFVRPVFLRYLVGIADGYDVVVPVTGHGYEPLCAVYAKSCLDPISASLDAGQLKIASFFDRVRVRPVRPEDTPLFDPRALFNVNTPDEYAEALKMLEEETSPPRTPAPSQNQTA